MSILLNALKKSEAQRQVGGPPDIHSPVQLAPEKHSAGNRWLFWVLLTLAVALLGWFGWQQYFPSAADEAPVQVAESGSGPAPSKEAPEAAEDMRAATEMVGTQESAPVVTNFPPTRGVDEEQRKKELSQSFTRFEAEPQAAAGEQVPAEPDTESGSESMDQVASTMESIAPQQTAEQEPGAPSRQRQSRSSPDDAASSQPKESEPISFWQVPQNLRDNLPEFRITVLVYAENPEDRFVLINGVRLLEKEELVSGVTLDEIRRDGAVFRYRNYRFLVKG